MFCHWLVLTLFLVQTSSRIIKWWNWRAYPVKAQLKWPITKSSAFFTQIEPMRSSTYSSFPLSHTHLTHSLKPSHKPQPYNNFSPNLPYFLLNLRPFLHPAHGPLYLSFPQRQTRQCLSLPLPLLSKAKDWMENRPNGLKWRFCVNFRVLNANTVKYHFPILTNDKLLKNLGAINWFSKLNLA